MCWIVFAMLAVLVAASAAYRYYFGKWPLRWNS